MASIPLPALAIKQPEGPIEQFGRAMQLKQLAGAGKLQQGEIQMQQMQLQQAQMQLEDQKKIRQAFVDSNGDLDSTIEKARKAGVNPQTLLQLKNAQIDQATKLQTLKKDALDNMKKQNDAIGASAQAVLGVSPENRPQAYQQEMKKLLAQGIVSPEQAATPYSEDEVRLHAAAAMTADQQISTELKKREVAAQELKAQTDAAKLKAEMPGGPLAPVDKAEMNDWLAKNPGKGPSDFMAYKAKLVPQFNFNLQSGGMGNANDPVTQELAKKVASGDMKITDVLTMRTPVAARKAFLGLVMQANPNYDSKLYDIEKGVMKSATSGDIGKNLTAFNTAIEHSKQLDEAAKAMSIGDNRTLNKIGNALGYEFGSDRTTNFNVIKNALAGEISKVFKGGQATDAEIKAVEQPFDAANSPAQLRGAIANAVRLMNSKRDALKQQVEKGMKGQANFGGGYTPPAGAPTATGPGGHKLVLDNGKWVDAETGKPQ